MIYAGSACEVFAAAGRFPYKWSVKLTGARSQQGAILKHLQRAGSKRDTLQEGGGSNA